MIVVMRVSVSLALFGIFFASEPALACDTGPFAVEFPMGATYLGNDAKGELSYGKEMLQSADLNRAKQKRLEIAFYILDQRRRRQNPDFWNTRQRNIERYLKSIGVPPRSYSIVFRQSSQKPSMSMGERRQNTDVTINLVEGGCG